MYPVGGRRGRGGPPSTLDQSVSAARGRVTEKRGALNNVSRFTHFGELFLPRRTMEVHFNPSLAAGARTDNNAGQGFPTLWSEDEESVHGFLVIPKIFTYFKA